MYIKTEQPPSQDVDIEIVKKGEKEIKQSRLPPSPVSSNPPSSAGEDKNSKDSKSSKPHRVVRVHSTNDDRAQAVRNGEFCTNAIKTSKYTPWTFLPMNLFFQCTRAANLYFIFIAILQLIPGFSPTSWSTTVAPLVFVMSLNALKEGLDEYKRTDSDRAVNKQQVDVVNQDGTYVTTKWSSVIVGDVVRVKSDEEIPADLVLLSSSDEKGLAYIETASLDGETNLKIRNIFQNELKEVHLIGLTIECEPPNNRLYKFDGAINLQDDSKLPLDTRQLLLRGATLRNTDWILGAVIYTGADTKFVLNMIPGRVKVTGLEKNMNLLVLYIFLFQTALCVGLAAASENWTDNMDNQSYYIPDFQELSQKSGSPIAFIAAQYGRFLILLNQLIPISLYVTLELVKVAQSNYINWDLRMYHAESKSYARARTTSLNEELGQVQYVMSDKTGTLTQNIMAFVQCSINGVIYGAIQEGRDPQRAGPEDTIHSVCDDPKLIQTLQGGAEDPQSSIVRAFFCHLAICHAIHPVFAKKNENGFTESSVIKYTGPSPDEEALVQGAANCGYQLRKRTQDTLLVSDPAKGEQAYLILAELEFTSERKRMSIICRDSEQRITLYCKGADSVIFQRLAEGQEPSKSIAMKHLEGFAKNGHRTMCMAQRRLSVDEYENWAVRFRAASTAMEDRDEKLAAVSEIIERNMFLFGVTAVEDKLQEEVPETITLLASAGIKIWVLTGDKLETAVSIALSCNLLNESMHQFRIADEASDYVPELLQSMLEEAKTRLEKKRSPHKYVAEMATIIEGSSLSVALEEKNKLLLLELLKLCKAVVCCRVSPLQKAQVTSLMKDQGKSMVLAIGDGANDCGMITVAQIGVGIGGREGMAAVLASDFSIARFRYLRRLLLIHGRLSYKRNKELVMFAFYKNFVYVMANAYFAFYSGYSSAAIHTAEEIGSYNVVWTSLPTMACAIFDKDVIDCIAESTPQLYMETQGETRRKFFKCLISWTISAIWDSLIAFYLPLSGALVFGKFGEDISIYEFGSIAFTMAIFIVTLKIMTRMHLFNWVHLATITISITWVLIFVILSFLLNLSDGLSDLFGVGQAVLGRRGFWLLLILCPAVAIFPSTALRIFRNQRAPSDSDIMREIEQGWVKGTLSLSSQQYYKNAGSRKFDANFYRKEKASASVGADANSVKLSSSLVKGKAVSSSRADTDSVEVPNSSGKEKVGTSAAGADGDSAEVPKSAGREKGDASTSTQANAGSVEIPNSSGKEKTQPSERANANSAELQQLPYSHGTAPGSDQQSGSRKQVILNNFQSASLGADSSNSSDDDGYMVGKRQERQGDGVGSFQSWRANVAALNQSSGSKSGIGRFSIIAKGQNSRGSS